MSGSRAGAQRMAGRRGLGIERVRLSVINARHAAQFHEPVRVFALSRLLFLLLTYFGIVLFNSVLHGPHPSFLHQLLPSWNQWDTRWYIDIAQRGYGWKKAVGTSPTAFFPLYPLLLRVAFELTHRSYILLALVVSNLAFLAAMWYLWRLTAWELSESAASRAILYIAVFPTALFFFAGYTESLFLWLTLASFYHLRRHDWLAAGAFGALASATRVTGVLLVLPFVYEYGRSCNFSWRRVDRGLAAVLLIPAGLLAFMFYLQREVGDALAFSHYQAAWQKVFTLELWAGFLDSVRQIVVVQSPVSFYEAHNLLEVCLGGLVLLGSIAAARKLPAAYGLYLAGFWAVTLTSPALAGGYPVPLISLSRYILALFPVFMYMGLIGSRRSRHPPCRPWTRRFFVRTPACIVGTRIRSCTSSCGTNSSDSTSRVSSSRLMNLASSVICIRRAVTSSSRVLVSPLRRRSNHESSFNATPSARSPR